MLKGKCREASRLLSKRLEQPLMPLEQWPLQMHLLVCPSCRAFEQQIRVLRQASRQLAGQDDQSSP
jgi:predicted anti-sigma-YlaC factor YlaD